MISPTGDPLQVPRKSPFYAFPLVGPRRTKPQVLRSAYSFVEDYARDTTFHGIKYVFRDTTSYLQRSIWAVMILFSVSLTTAICSYMVLKFNTKPTSTLVKDTHYPLYLFPFPGITVCPTDKIKRGAAFSYIYSKLNLSTENEVTNNIDNFLNAMVLLKHPHYHRMHEYLENAIDILPRLALLNLTDFMLAVMPSCEEVFVYCSWHGMTESCCDIFHVQRSEEGFCYSFNTFTSQTFSHCPQHSYDNNIDFAEIEAEVSAECELRRNSASGPTTGIQVFLRHPDPNERLPNWSYITGESGVKVQMNTYDEYPEAGMGVLVPAKAGLKMTTTVKAYITESLPAIRSLPIDERNCYFPDEMRLEVAAQYSQRSCLLECRLDYFHRVCGCRPYYFNMLDNRVPVCNATQLWCLAEHGSSVKFYNPPPEALEQGFTTAETSHGLNCSHCLPTCHETYYDDDTDLTSDTQQRALETFGYLDVYYKYGGAVYYQRDVDFGLVELLVSIGGTAGLFLGVSLLSGCELLYLLTRLLIHAFFRKYSSNPLKNPPLHKGLIYNKDFYNN